MRDLRVRAFLAMVLPLILLLALAGGAAADVKITAILNSWDDAFERYENGMLTLYADSELQPFWIEIGYDDDLHTVACGETMWAGDAEIGLYHTDNMPLGAPGFVSTQDWSLVKCSTFETNKYPAPADIISECMDPSDPTYDPNVEYACEVISHDVVVDCETGNCLNEIETNFDLVLDADCDGVIDDGFDPEGGLCMYWAAVKPPAVSPAWGGNIQVRVNSAGDGDKTINFNVEGPNAISVQGFAGGSASPLAGALGVLVVGLAGLALAWRSARG